MRSNLFSNFQDELNKIREYLKHLVKLADAVGENRAASVSPPQAESKVDALAKHFVSKRQNLKRFEYNAVIITLYGVFENTISLWIEEFLVELSKILPYASLPQKIQSIHLDLSLALVKQVENDKYLQYKKITKNSVLKNLYDCSINNENYALNVKAFTMQAGNLKHERIRTILKNLNINFLKKNDSSQTIIDALDELIAERNNIAHGNNSTIQLRTPDLLEIDIENIEKYSKLVFEALDLQYKKLTNYFHKDKWQEIKFVQAFPRYNAYGFEAESLTIKKGDVLLISYPIQNIKQSQKILLAPNFDVSKIKFYEINTIRIDKKEESEAIITQKTVVTLGLGEEQPSPKIKENQKFYLLKK